MSTQVTPVVIDVNVKVKKEWKPYLILGILFIAGLAVGAKLAEYKS